MDAPLLVADPAMLVAKMGGSHAAALGIDLASLSPVEVYRWFIAALLYGAPIPERTATRTWHEFERSGLLAPERMLAAGWDALVAVLDRGGYARYDFKTATKLIEVNRALLSDYGGDLNALHAASRDGADLERRVRALGKGIGPVTAGIFLRELRGKWSKADPALSPLALLAARTLGYPGAEEADPLPRLEMAWQSHGGTDGTFADFEAALVRTGRRFRRRHLAANGKT